MVEILRSDVPHTIVTVYITGFFLELGCPFGAIVAPWSKVSLLAPGIAHFYQSLAIAESECIQHGVGMHISDAEFILVLVGACACGCTCSDHPATLHLFVKPFPQLLNAHLAVVHLEEGRTRESLDGGSHPTARKHFVVSKKLRGRLL